MSMVSSLKRYCYLLKKFRNGIALINNFRSGGYLQSGPILEQAVLWDGRIIHHPPYAGLVGILLEIWYENEYRINDFYKPCDGDVIVDVGAHVGLFAFNILEQNPRCRLFCIEPAPENSRCLQANLEGFTPGAVKFYPFAIGASFDKGSLEIKNSSFDNKLSDFDSDGGIAVDVVPLSHIFELTGSERIQLLKMDVEGGEKPAFENASEKDISRIERVMMEYHDNLQPGALKVVRDKLEKTHEIEVLPHGDSGHGMIFAKLRDDYKSSPA